MFIVDNIRNKFMKDSSSNPLTFNSISITQSKDNDIESHNFLYYKSCVPKVEAVVLLLSEHKIDEICTNPGPPKGRTRGSF